MGRKMRRKDESHSRDRQKKEDWIGEQISKKDESHSRDRQKKKNWIEEKMKVTGVIDRKRKTR